MKFILSLFVIAILTLSCNSTKETIKADKATEPNAKLVEQTRGSKEVSEYYSTKSITYTSRSRSAFEYIDISKSKITYSTDPYLKELKLVDCSADDWQDLKRLLREIDTQSLSTLKAPTDKRLYDGAAHTTFSVREGDVLFETPTFDEGHPPVQIKILVNKVLSIKESIVKQ